MNLPYLSGMHFTILATGLLQLIASISLAYRWTVDFKLFENLYA